MELLEYIDILRMQVTNNPGLSRRQRAEGLRAIEAEIMGEKAEALGRAGQRLEEALRVLENARGTIDEIEIRLRDCGSSPEELSLLREARADLTARLKVLRDQADQAYQFLIIQREAVGVRNHLDVERCYGISERLR